MEEFLSHYGYLTLIIGILIEGEAMLIEASFSAHRGFLSLSYVIILSFLVTNLLDWSYFFLGKSKGRKYLANKDNLSIQGKGQHDLSFEKIL